MNRPVVMFVVGARPQLVKDAALTLTMRADPGRARFSRLLVNSGQHYDDMLSDVFFRELPMDRPDRELSVGSGAPDVQFGQILNRLTSTLEETGPEAVVVYGDTTTTLAASLAAAYRDVPVVHVEAGERAYQRTKSPEELNRILTDHAATLCLAVSERSRERLRGEGVSTHRIRVVGDLMYDLFRWAVGRVGPPPSDGAYDVATIHRAENTDDPGFLRELLGALDEGPRRVILPAHPRLRKALAQTGWQPDGALEIRDRVVQRRVPVAVHRTPPGRHAVDQLAAIGERQPHAGCAAHD